MLLQESVRRSFISTQVVDLEIKAIEANKYINEYIESLTAKHTNSYIKILLVLSEILAKITFIFEKDPNINTIYYLWNLTKKIIDENLEASVISLKDLNKKLLYQSIIKFLQIIAKIYIDFYLGYDITQSSSKTDKKKISSEGFNSYS